MIELSEARRLAIQGHFHEVIRTRAADFSYVRVRELVLPDLPPSLPESDEELAWFPVEGMTGGFAYRYRGEGEEAILVVESWCRVVGGSGQRHEVTPLGSKLVAEGFA